MNINDFKKWLKSWDSGEFDFTEALSDSKKEEIIDNVKSDPNHPWKSKKMDNVEKTEIKTFKRIYPLFVILLSGIIVSFLLYSALYLPAFGSIDSPAHNEVMDRYVENGIEETGAVNVVAGVILDYRAFDTLGESHVLFTATIAVFILLLTIKGENEPENEIKIIQKDTLLHSTANIIVPMVILYGIYVILNGHLGPGGGFSGGAVIGGGLILYALTYGFDKLDKFLNIKIYRIVVLCALCFYSLAKCYSFFCGANHLETIFGPGVPGMILSAGLILPLNLAVGIVVSLTMYGFYSIFQRGHI